LLLAARERAAELPNAFFQTWEALKNFYRPLWISALSLRR
jgi:hypothetical protein